MSKSPEKRCFRCQRWFSAGEMASSLKNVSEENKDVVPNYCVKCWGKLADPDFGIRTHSLQCSACERSYPQEDMVTSTEPHKKAKHLCRLCYQHSPGFWSSTPKVTKIPVLPADDFPSLTKPSHYATQVPGIECWDVTQHFNFNRGNIIKYCWRCGQKGGTGDAIRDLKKCIEYAKHEIERIEKEFGDCTTTSTSSI